MSNAAILYLRLLRRIVRESACRLGGAEETYLAAGFGGGERPDAHGDMRSCVTEHGNRHK